MWARFYIKCKNCDKITLLRYHVNTDSNRSFIFKCENCSSEIKGFEKKSKIVIECGDIVTDNSEISKTEFYISYSDVLPVEDPSANGLFFIPPTLQFSSDEVFFKARQTSEERTNSINDNWEDFKNAVRMYKNFDKPVLKTIIERIIKRKNTEITLDFLNDLDYHGNFYLVLNIYMFPWIDKKNHLQYIEWLHQNIFNFKHISNTDFLNFLNSITTESYCKEVLSDFTDLLLQFSEIKKYYLSASLNFNNTNNFISNADFVKIKNFYTDCFEFLGRTSHLIFRLQNFYERGGTDNIPPSAPRNVTNAEIFHTLNHGDKLDVLKLSSENILKELYIDIFDNKLRNGINHFRTKFNNQNQIISYYPKKNDPSFELQISYHDFLNKSLKILNSVLKIGQLMKFILIHKYAINNQKS